MPPLPLSVVYRAQNSVSHHAVLLQYPLPRFFACSSFAQRPWRLMFPPLSLPGILRSSRFSPSSKTQLCRQGRAPPPRPSRSEIGTRATADPPMQRQAPTSSPLSTSAQSPPSQSLLAVCPGRRHLALSSPSSAEDFPTDR